MTAELLLTGRLKGYPVGAEPVPLQGIGSKGWHVLDARMSYPLAVLRRSALVHNIEWMQAFANRKGVVLAPHGKTTLSPQLMRMQLTAGAWGLTFADVHQAQVGVDAGARRILIANQVVALADLDGLDALLRMHAGLQVWFLVDHADQLALLREWAALRQSARVWQVLLEMGIDGQRTGCRTLAQALALADAIHASPDARLCGVECYEGGVTQCLTEDDSREVARLVRRVQEVVRELDAGGLWQTDEVILSAGGSAVFDLVLPMLAAYSLTQPVQGVLRSGCYVTHDHGRYAEFLKLLEAREGLADSLRPALEVWALVQSVPEPGLALLTCGRRDISFDQQMPVPVGWAPRQLRPGDAVREAPASWRVIQLNDQHAYLRFDAAHTAPDAVPHIGDRVALGVSHPCTTFDRWRWMAVVDDAGGIVDAISTCF